MYLLLGNGCIPIRCPTELDWKILSLVKYEILLSLGNGLKNISDEHFRIL